MKEMWPEFVVQSVRDRLAFLVVSVEHPFDQLPIGRAKARERFGEAIDPSFSDLATCRVIRRGHLDDGADGRSD